MFYVAYIVHRGDTVPPEVLDTHEDMEVTYTHILRVLNLNTGTHLKLFCF